MYFEKMNHVDLYINSNDPVANNVLIELLKMGVIEQSKIRVNTNVYEHQGEFLTKMYTTNDRVGVYIKSTMNNIPTDKVIMIVYYKGTKNYLWFINDESTLGYDINNVLSSFNETINSNVRGYVNER